MNPESDTEAAIGVRRQRIVLTLQESPEPMTIDELVDVLEADPAVRSDAPGTPDTWEEFHRELYEFDLPALDDVGLITFDDERGMVGNPGGSLTGDILAAARDTDSDTEATTSGDDVELTDGENAVTRWSPYYLVLSIAAVTWLGLVWVTPGAPREWSFAVVAGLFLLLSVVHFSFE